MKSEENLLQSCLIKNCSLNNGERKGSLRGWVCYSIINYYYVNKINNNVTNNNGVTYTLSTENGSRGDSLSTDSRNNANNLLISNNPLCHPSSSVGFFQEVLQT